MADSISNLLGLLQPEGLVLGGNVLRARGMYPEHQTADDTEAVRFAFAEGGANDGEAPEDAFLGLVHEAVLNDHPDLSAYDVYMSGPPAMIDAGKRAFEHAGVPEERLFYDSFEFGLDVPVSVLAKPH